MAFQGKGTEHRSRPLYRPQMIAGIAIVVAMLVLTACGGNTNAITVPTSAATATTASAATVAAVGGQAGVAPTNASIATVITTATQAAATAAPASVASIATTTPKPAVAPNAGSVAGKIDPCTLITKADYLAAMGDAANDPVKKDRPTVASSGISQSSCDYKIAAGNKVESVTINVMQRDPSTAAKINMKMYWEGTKKAWASMQAKVTPLPEIGPEVFLVVNPLLEQIGAGGAVHFIKGDVIFDVRAVTGSGTVDEQNAAGAIAAKKLAIMAFGRL